MPCVKAPYYSNITWSTRTYSEHIGIHTHTFGQPLPSNDTEKSECAIAAATAYFCGPTDWTTEWAKRAFTGHLQAANRFYLSNIRGRPTTSAAVCHIRYWNVPASILLCVWLKRTPHTVHNTLFYWGKNHNILTETQIEPLCNTQIKQSLSNTINTVAGHNDSNSSRIINTYSYSLEVFLTENSLMRLVKSNLHRISLSMENQRKVIQSVCANCGSPSIFN